MKYVLATLLSLVVRYRISTVAVAMIATSIGVAMFADARTQRNGLVAPGVTRRAIAVANGQFTFEVDAASGELAILIASSRFN